jgi:cytoskeletal protein CcmA (bactofilin family)
MKKMIKMFILFALITAAGTMNAQDLRKGGSSFGKIESNGDVRLGGSVKGKFESNGDVRIGGSVKGKIESNGDIRKNGSVVGSAKGVNQRIAAVMFFFDFF